MGMAPPLSASSLCLRPSSFSPNTGLGAPSPSLSLLSHLPAALAAGFCSGSGSLGLELAEQTPDSEPPPPLPLLLRLSRQALALALALRQVLALAVALALPDKCAGAPSAPALLVCLTTDLTTSLTARRSRR